jgi:hypothetical protein
MMALRKPLLRRSAALAALCFALAAGLTTANETKQVTVRPADSGEALENPGMGWVFHHYDNGITGYGPPLGPGYDGREFPGLTIAYLRLAWSHLEPVEGEINWAIFDTPIQRYGAAGKGFALRLTVFEGDPKQGTPEWVRAAGAKGQIVETFGVKSWEPDYDDPIFLAKLERFLVAAGARYGSSPRLAFVDVGTLGIWGEGHPIGRTYGLGTLRRHIELHRRAFPKSLLVAQDDWVTWFQEPAQPKTAALDLAGQLGLTFRDDSLCVYPDPKLHYSAGLAQPFWPENPVILEMGHYDYAKQVKAWETGQRYFQAVEDYHASYASVHADPIKFLAENVELIRQINVRLGYRIHLVEASWPETFRREEGLSISARWRNAGVAPCLPGGHPSWSLYNEKQQLCATLVDAGFDVRDLPPGSPGQAVLVSRQRTFRLPADLQPGRHQIWVSVADTTGTPRLALPLPGGGAQLRYRLGDVVVR